MTEPICSSNAHRYRPELPEDEPLCSHQPEEPARASLLDAWERQQRAIDGDAGEPAVWEPEVAETRVSWECWNDCVGNQAGTMLPSSAIVGVATIASPVLGAGLLGFSAGLYGGACYEACADLESPGVPAPETLGETRPPAVYDPDGPDASLDPADASGYETPRD